MAGGQGSVDLDFGAFPGASDATVTVTGQTGILTTALVEAWIFPSVTTDHSVDEHMLETLKVFADPTTIVVDAGFVIRGFNTSQMYEPVDGQLYETGRTGANVQAPGKRQRSGGAGTLIYGKFKVAYCWNNP